MFSGGVHWHWKRTWISALTQTYICMYISGICHRRASFCCQSSKISLVFLPFNSYKILSFICMCECRYCDSWQRIAVKWQNIWVIRMLPANERACDVIEILEEMLENQKTKTKKILIANVWLITYRRSSIRHLSVRYVWEDVCCRKSYTWEQQ